MCVRNSELKSPGTAGLFAVFEIDWNVLSSRCKDFYFSLLYEVGSHYIMRGTGISGYNENATPPAGSRRIACQVWRR